MAKYVIDMESDALLDEVTLIHVIGWHNVDTGKSGTITDYPTMKRFLSQDNLTLICHNIIRFDVPVFEKILNIKITARIIDTLVLSWYLYPNRNVHGLEAFGEEFGVPKPKVVDWVNEHISVYVNRVEEDVKINLQLFLNQMFLLKLIYNDDIDEVRRVVNYLCYKIDCAKEQEDIRWKLDKLKCEDNLRKFEEELERKNNILIEHMPEHILYKTLNRPKIMHKKDESLSKRGEDWLSLLAELQLEEDTQSLRLEKSRELGNPGSHQQLKEWLFSLGWNPVTFKYEKNDKGTVRKIPQVSLPRGEGLCSSVKELYEVEPLLEELDMFYVIKHRVGILKGFLRDVNEEGYIQARVAGLTNTLRFKHAVCVNLPGVTSKDDWRDGEHIRGCLIAPEGHVLCGSDMSSLEDRTKQHYMYYFDPDYVDAMNKPDFDPHLDLALFAYQMTNGAMGCSQEDLDFYKSYGNKPFHDDAEISRYTHIKHQRHMFKTTNYGAVYGAGASTMSRTTGMSLQDCSTLLEAYWEKNFSVKEIEKACVVKKISGMINVSYKHKIYHEDGKLDRVETRFKQKKEIQMWQYNPVSKFWYSLRYMKDRFSTLNQGTGVYCFDMWIRKSRQKGIKMCGQFHDEIVTPVIKGEEETVELKLRQAIQEVNVELNLNRALGIDVQFGSSYAKIH